MQQGKSTLKSTTADKQTMRKQSIKLRLTCPGVSDINSNHCNAQYTPPTRVELSRVGGVY